jgi:hypothetical protein
MRVGTIGEKVDFAHRIQILIDNKITPPYCPGLLISPKTPPRKDKWGLKILPGIRRRTDASLSHLPICAFFLPTAAISFYFYYFGGRNT